MGAAIHQGQGSGTPDITVHTTALANNLIRGLMPVPFDWDVKVNPGTEYRTKTSDAFFSYAGVPAQFPDWLIYGEAVAPLPLVSEDVATYYFDRLSNRVNITLPAAVIGSFAAASSGAHGSVLASVVD